MPDDPSDAPGCGGCADGGIARRDFLTVVGLGVAAMLAGCTPEAREEFLRRRFRELSPAEVEERVARVQADVARRFGR